MRKDNAIFFLSGLAFGVLLGYFVFQSVVQDPGNVSMAAQVGSLGSFGGSSGVWQPAPRKVLDRQEVAALESVLQRNPEDDITRIQLGNLYLEAGHDDEAIPWFRRALEREPDNAHARVHLAQSLANIGRVEEAISEYEAVLAREPGNPQALLGLGRVKLYAQQDIRGGVEAWEELLRVAPNSREATSISDELDALKSAHATN
jgi:tetratricopeptide (TPR) repeat protein